MYLFYSGVVRHLKLHAPLKAQQVRDKTVFMDDQTVEESLLPKNVVPEPEAVPLQQQVYVLMLFGGYVWDTPC